jgi:hypothetical protein
MARPQNFNEVQVNPLRPNQPKGRRGFRFLMVDSTVIASLRPTSRNLGGFSITGLRVNPAMTRNGSYCHPELVSGSLPKVYRLEMLNQVQHDSTMVRPGTFRLEMLKRVQHDGTMEINIRPGTFRCPCGVSPVLYDGDNYLL